MLILTNRWKITEYVGFSEFKVTKQCSTFLQISHIVTSCTVYRNAINFSAIFLGHLDIFMCVSQSIVDVYTLLQTFMHNGLNSALEFGFNIVLIKWGDTWHSMMSTQTFTEKCSASQTLFTRRKYAHQSWMDVFNTNNMVITVTSLVWIS